jgi:transcriptional regulator with XRE-family HTH domain
MATKGKKPTNGLGVELRRLREKAGLTLRQAEEACGVSNAFISQLENSKATNPSMASLTKLAGLYKVKVETLFKAAGWI